MGSTMEKQQRIQQLKQRREELAGLLQNPTTTGDRSTLVSYTKEYNDIERTLAVEEKARRVEKELREARETAAHTDDPDLRVLALEESDRLTKEHTSLSRALDKLIQPP